MLPATHVSAPKNAMRAMIVLMMNRLLVSDPNGVGLEGLTLQDACRAEATRQLLLFQALAHVAVRPQLRGALSRRVRPERLRASRRDAVCVLRHPLWTPALQRASALLSVSRHRG